MGSGPRRTYWSLPQQVGDRPSIKTAMARAGGPVSSAIECSPLVPRMRTESFWSIAVQLPPRFFQVLMVVMFGRAICNGSLTGVPLP